MIEERITRLSPQQRQVLADKIVAHSAAKITKGSDKPQLVAWFTTHGSADVTETALRSHVSERLATSAIPRRFVQVHDLPKTATGKIDRVAATQIRAAARPIEPPDRVAPSPMQESLREIWTEVLGIADFSPDDNFFHIGGDSLSLINLVAISRGKGLTISPNDVYECPSLRDLAKRAECRMQREVISPAVQPSSASFVAEVRMGTEPGSILFLHDIRGTCRYAGRLISELATEKTICVAEQPYPMGDINLDQTMEGLATRYVNELLERDPTGPYIIVGYCWAGLLAYEISIQLESRGCPAKRTILIEADATGAYRHAPFSCKMRDWFRGIITRVRRRISSDGFRDGINSLIRTAFRKCMRRDAQDVFSENDPLPEYAERPTIFRHNRTVHFGYQIPRSKIRLEILTTASQAYLSNGAFLSPMLGWEYAVGQHATRHAIVGDHTSCVGQHAVSTVTIINDLL